MRPSTTMWLESGPGTVWKRRIRRPRPHGEPKLTVSHCRSSLGRVVHRSDSRAPPVVGGSTDRVQGPFTISGPGLHLASLPSDPGTDPCLATGRRGPRRTTHRAEGHQAVKLSRSGRLTGVALVGTLALAACGSDNNTGSTASLRQRGVDRGSATSSIDCADGTLNASGSTAQANAMTQWIKDYQSACSGATVNYNGVGSGQGVTDFLNGQTAFGRLRLGAQPGQGRAGQGQRPVQDRPGRRPADGRRARSPSSTTSSGRRQADHDAVRPGQDLQRQDHQVERPGDRRDQQRRDPAVRRRSPPSTARTPPAPRTTSPST